MSTSSLRIGVVGVGFGATVQIPGFQSEGVEVIAVCSRRLHRVQKTALDFDIPYAFTDYAEMLKIDGLDAVSIVTAPALHHPMTIAALEAGKHVLCEKPFALDRHQGMHMLETAQRSGLTAMITHEFRFAPQRTYVKSLLDQGYIGDLKIAHLSMFTSPQPGGLPRPTAWLLDESQGGGILFALGSHYIDGLRHWFGEIVGVGGRVWTNHPNRVDADAGTPVKATADDAFTFALEFEHGGHATMHATTIAPFGSGTRIELYGTRGTLVANQTGVNPHPDGIVQGAQIGDSNLHDLPTPSHLQALRDERDPRSLPFRLLVREFLRGIKEKTSPSPNFSDGLRCQRVLDAVLESSRTGKWIDTLPG